MHYCMYQGGCALMYVPRYVYITVLTRVGVHCCMFQGGCELLYISKFFTLLCALCSVYVVNVPLFSSHECTKVCLFIYDCLKSFWLLLGGGGVFLAFIPPPPPPPRITRITLLAVFMYQLSNGHLKGAFGSHRLVCT